MATKVMLEEGNSITTSGGGDDGGGGGDRGGGKGFMLFGVRLMEAGSFRKSASMTNLARFEQSQDSNMDVTIGYESDDVVHPSRRNRERKKGVAWTEEEHKLFLLGLQKVGKGDWRGIARNFVKTRTPTQVASHAQKYFLRRNNNNIRRRRSSLFDITTHELVLGSFEDQANQETLSMSQMQHQHINQNSNMYLMPSLALQMENEKSMQNLTLGGGEGGPPPNTTQIYKSPNLIIPHSPKMANLNSIPLHLSLKLSTSPTAFQAMPTSSFNSGSGDSIISVA